MQVFSWHRQGWASAYENKITMSARFIFFRKSMGQKRMDWSILKKIHHVFLFFKQVKQIFNTLKKILNALNFFYCKFDGSYIGV
jgi:hypothetical protein